MLKEVFVIAFLILLSSTVESQNPVLKKILKIVRTIRNQMVTFDEITEIKNQFVDEVKVVKNQIVDEVVGEIKPTITSSCSCCHDEPTYCNGGQGVFIASGVGDSWGTASLPGFYNPVTNEYCDLPPMVKPRYGSTTTGFKVCGGNDLGDYYDYYDYYYSTSNSPESSAPYTCETFDLSTGTWSVGLSWEFAFPPRYVHVAWMSSIGLFLIGGIGSEAQYSSMLINNDGFTEGAIDSGRWGACAVADPKTDTVIIIGGNNGAGTTNEVVRYDIEGNAYPLPPLTSTNKYIGCSGYYNHVGNLVLVVTGGTAGYTEHLEVGVDSTWTPNYDCFNPLDISCANVTNDVYCLQGYLGYEIQEYDPSTGCFIYKTSTEDSRSYDGNFASPVCIDGVEKWCTYSKSDKKSEPQDHSKPFPQHSKDDKNVPSNN